MPINTGIDRPTKHSLKPITQKEWDSLSPQERNAAGGDYYISDRPKKEGTAAEPAKPGKGKEDPDLWINRYGEEAKRQKQEAMGQAQAMFGDYDKFAADATAANQRTEADLGGYIGQLNTEYANVGNQGWKDYKSLGKGYDAQLDALQKYKGLTDPRMTAEERYMQEQARLGEEQGLRANRDAVLGDLGARGMRGSGAELTNMLGAQQQLGQQRVLGDLGAQANASKRAMTALEGYGRVGGEMRSAEDVVGQFNAGQGQLAREWQSEQQQKIRGQQNTARTTADDTTYGRTQDMANAQANVRKNYNDTLSEFGGRVIDFKRDKAGYKGDIAAADKLAENDDDYGWLLNPIVKPIKRLAGD